LNLIRSPMRCSVVRGSGSATRRTSSTVIIEP